MQILPGFGLRIIRKVIFPHLISALLLIPGIPDLIAQQEATYQQIKSFATEQSETFKLQKAEAVRIATEKGWVIKKNLRGGGLMEIMNIGSNGIPEYYITDNLNAAITSGTSDLWADSSSGLDLDGAGFLIGEWDGGKVRRHHQEFHVGTYFRITFGDDASDLLDHSTHVAGTLIASGHDHDAHGMAPAALLHTYDWNDDLSEMADAYADDDLTLSNHSYGFIRGWHQDEDNGLWYWYGDIEISQTEDYLFGFYEDHARIWDSLAYQCPYYLIVKSAGNDRGEYHSGSHLVLYNGQWIGSDVEREKDGGTDGYDCMGNQGVAKNLLIVGAVADIPGGYTGPGDVSVLSFSNWGPTDDGRIKPDIVANGSGLYSAFSANDQAYDDLSGTSMASPTVCGTIALLQDYYQSLHSGNYMRSSTVKALIINTAYECGTYAGPDYSYGWGLLNSAGAANLITQDDVEGDLINLYNLFNNEIEIYIYYSTGNTPVNVTICWTDPPGTPPSPALNPTALMLVNDLDMRIVRTGGSTYYPWKKSPVTPALPAITGDNYRDNVEKITIATPPPGEYTISVDHKGTISNQYYSMVISGLTSTRPTNTWTGRLGADWATTANWSLNHQPIGSEKVAIPAGCPNYPVLTNNLGIGYNSGYTNICYNLTIASGATMTLNGWKIYCAGEMNINGALYIGDDLILNNGAVLNLSATGTIYTGYVADFDGMLALNQGSSFVQSGGNIYAEQLLLYEGSQYNATAGIFHLYKQGYANNNQLIQINDPDNHFYNFYVDTLTQVYLDNCSDDLNVDMLSRVSGKLSLNSYSMNAYLMSVYGELNITTGSLNITQTGPALYNNSILNMVGGELTSNNSVWFYTGCNVNVTDGSINIRRDLHNQNNEFSPSGGIVRFFGDQTSNIAGATTFFQLEIEKDEGFAVISANNVHVADSLIILSGKLQIPNATLHVGASN
jgi:hypothetical protein